MAVRKGIEACALGISQTGIVDDSLRQQIPPGFRHFLSTPKASQRFKAYGIDPVDAPEQSHKVRGLMNRLSRRMDAELRWPAHADPTIERWENPRIPSGYTNGHWDRPTCAQARVPIDEMVSGSAMSLFQASQAASMMAS